MKERFNLFINNINRLLSNDDISYKVYLVLFVATVLIVGVFGVIPSSKILFSNVNLALEINKNNKLLSNKITELRKVDEELKKAGSNVSYLEYYLPEKFNIQDYIIDFVFASGEADFLVERIIPVKEVDSTIDLSVVLIGNGDVGKLVNVLESLSRVTEIQSIRVSKGKEYSTLSMLIRTFVMEKQ